MTIRRVFLGLTCLVLAVHASGATSVPVVEAVEESSSVQASSEQPVDDLGGTDSAPAINAPIVLLNQIDRLEREIMALRGIMEELTNTIGQLRKSNRDRYLDLDRRISRLAAGPSVTEPATAATTAATASVGQASSVAANVPDEVSDSGDVLYRDTFQLIRDRQFDQALIGLKKYLADYPNGTYADNTQYWLGEVHLAEDRLKEAQADFSTLLTNYPFSDKMADATYKLGQVYDRLGDKVKAREYLQRAVKNYPDSSAARLADVYLQNLEG